MLYNPLYTKQDLSNWNVSEDTFRLVSGHRVSDDELEKLASNIQSQASKEYFINYIIYDLKTDINNEDIYNYFIRNTEIVLNNETNLITISIPYQKEESRVAQRLVDNLMLLMINESINRETKEYEHLKYFPSKQLYEKAILELQNIKNNGNNKQRLESRKKILEKFIQKYDLQNKLREKMLEKHEVRMQLRNKLDNNDLKFEKAKGGNFEIMESAQSSCSIF